MVQQEDYAKVERITATILDDPNALIIPATALAQHGYYTEAERVATGIQGDHEWSEPLNRLAVTLAAQDVLKSDTLFAEAKRVANRVEDDESRAGALRALAAAHWEVGHISEAMATLGPRKMDDYLRFLYRGVRRHKENCIEPS